MLVTVHISLSELPSVTERQYFVTDEKHKILITEIKVKNTDYDDPKSLEMFSTLLWKKRTIKPVLRDCSKDWKVVVS